MDFEAVEIFQLGHSTEMNGWHQMLETGVRGKSYMPLWITNATELLPRIALGVNVSLPIWRSRRTDIPSYPCWQIWLQGCDDLLRWHRYFCNVTHVSIQDKYSFNRHNLELKLWWGLLTLQSYGHYWYLGKLIFHIPYSHRMSQSFFSGHLKIIIFIFLTSNKEIMDDSHDLDQN